MNKYLIDNLTILLVILASAQLVSFSDPFTQIISVFIIISSIIYWIRDNAFEAILGGTLLTFLIDLIWHNCNNCNHGYHRYNTNNNISEHFENMDLSNLEKMISKLEKTTKDNPFNGMKDFNADKINTSPDTLSNTSKKNNTKENKKNTTEENDNINSYTKNDDELNDIIKNTSNNKSELEEDEYVNTLTQDDILHLEKDEDDDEQYKKNYKPKPKDIDNYKPHEAQRETYRIINTVKQLKDTIDSLTPTIKSGQHILKMLDKFQL